MYIFFVIKRPMRSSVIYAHACLMYSHFSLINAGITRHILCSMYVEENISGGIKNKEVKKSRNQDS
ncbi:hypothetical protein BDW42DRAFT_174710 [Aspergillus taichungensis]|uniref:Uncharacterized protein n=1 Tax=Aspergillus taichungensis TaxID=482145 RepID=A0A2J5HMU4_9EURO|nr:hypothetical protein BDW42DRAFT_174710 [Aspergillus taichungensis]